MDNEADENDNEENTMGEDEPLQTGCCLKPDSELYPPHKTPPKMPVLKPIDLYPSVLSMSQSAFSDTSSVLSPASSSENYNEPLNLSTDIEFTDSESEVVRQPICTTPLNKSFSKQHMSSFSPQRVLPSMSPLHGNSSPTRTVLPEGFSDNICALLPTSTVRVKVRSRHASFSTPPKSPADSQWRLFKVTKDMKEETFDDINGERNFTQSLTLKNACDAKLNVSDKEEASLHSTSCPSSPRHISSPARAPASSPRPRIERATLTGRSTTPSPSPPFAAPGPPQRCVSPGPARGPASFTLKRKIVEDCASPPKRPCTMGLGHRSPTVEYRARNNSPAPLSPLAVSSQSGAEGEVVRTVPMHLLDRAQMPEDCGSSGSSDDSPPRNIRLT